MESCFRQHRLRMVMAATIAVTLTACQPLALVSPADPLTERAMLEYATRLQLHLGSMAELAGKPEGSYEANWRSYQEMDAQLAALGEGNRLARGIEARGDVAADEILHGRRAAAIVHGGERNAARLRQHDAAEMRRAAGACRREARLVGIGAQPGDQFLHVLRRHRGMHHQHVRRCRDELVHAPDRNAARIDARSPDGSRGSFRARFRSPTQGWMGCLWTFHTGRYSQTIFQKR